MIKSINKLEDLAEGLVPEAIRENAPQFYGVIKAFLRNIEDVQTSINKNFLDTIDYSKILNPDYKKVILDIYLNSLNLKNESNLDAIGELIDVSKDISLIKGTSLLYEVLVRLLLFIIPGVGTQYNLLVEEYNNPLTSDSRKADLEIEILQLENDTYVEGMVSIQETYDINGDVVPFTYTTRIDLDILLYEKYIKPFAHISGWEEEFIQVVKRIMTDDLEFWDTVQILDTFDYPTAPADGSITFDGTVFPETTYSPALLGLASDYTNYSYKIINTSLLEVIGTELYYNWYDLKAPEFMIQENDNWIIKSPAYNNMLPTGGTYLADTTDIGIANGALTCGSFKLSYQILNQENKYFK